MLSLQLWDDLIFLFYCISVSYGVYQSVNAEPPSDFWDMLYLLKINDLFDVFRFQFAGILLRILASMFINNIDLCTFSSCHVNTISLNFGKKNLFEKV